MRYRVSLNDSILVEYNRDITAQKYGAKLPAALRKDQSAYFMHVDATAAADVELARALQRLRTQLKNVPTDYFPDKLDDGLRSEVVTTVLTALEKRDPSKTKEYTPWLAKVYGDGTVKFEDVNRQDLLTTFDTLKRKKKLKPEHRDIMRFKTYREFEDAVQSYPDEDTLSDDRGDHEVLYNGTDARIIKPADKTAGCFWGRGTRWCTAGRQNNMFDSYHGQGPIYILIPKHAQHAGEKYQFWFAKNFTNFESRDEQDDWADPEEIKNRYPEAIDFLIKHEPLSRNVVALLPKHHVDTLVRKFVEIAQGVADYFLENDKDIDADVVLYRHLKTAVFDALMVNGSVLQNFVRDGGVSGGDGYDSEYDDTEPNSMVVSRLPFHFFAERIHEASPKGTLSGSHLFSFQRYRQHIARMVGEIRLMPSTAGENKWDIRAKHPMLHGARGKVQITEALDTPLKWEWTEQSSDYHAAEFALPDGTPYIFEFRTVPFAPPDVWTIAFQPKGATDWDAQYGALNVGAAVAAKVLATAIQILQDFGRTKQPAEIIFGANANERGRIRLYQRLIQQFVPTVPKYEAMPMRNYGDDQKVFVVRHKEREGSRMFDAMFEDALVEMPIPDDWDDTVRNPHTPFTKRLAYAKEKAKRLGSGSSRVAFVIPYEGRDTVLKIAKNAKGLAQNEYEAEILSDGYAKNIGILIPMIDHDTNEPPTWLHVEKADRKTNDNDFKRVCGGTPADLVDWVTRQRTGQSRGWGGNYKNIDADSEFANAFHDLIGSFDMPAADFTRHANWGMWKGKPVIIDVGLSNDVLQKYYSPKQRVASFARKWNNRR